MITMDLIRIEPGTVEHLRRHGAGMIAAHWAEVGTEGLDLDPAWSKYEALEEAGYVAVNLATVIDTGAVVGYSLTTIGAHRHALGTKVATIDAIYVMPAARNGHVATRLLAAAEQSAREAGAAMISGHSPEGSAFGAVLESRGYAPHETILTRRL